MTERESLVASLRRRVARWLDPDVYQHLHSWQQDAEGWLVELGRAESRLRRCVPVTGHELWCVEDDRCCTPKETTP